MSVEAPVQRTFNPMKPLVDAVKLGVDQLFEVGEALPNEFLVGI